MEFTKQTAEYLLAQRWCNFKEEIRLGKITEFSVQSVPFDQGKKLFSIGQVKNKDGNIHCFVIPLQETVKAGEPVLPLNGKYYKDALKEKDYWQKLMQMFEQNQGEVHFPNGWVMKHKINHYPEVVQSQINMPSRPLGVEQSNTTLEVGNQKIAFKQERILDFSDKVNPEFSMNDKLMRENCSVMPKTYGGFFLYDNNGKIASAGIEQEYVTNKGDLWSYSLAYLKDKLARGYVAKTDLKAQDNPEFMDLMRNLSQKTAEMSECLSRPDDDFDFAPEQVDNTFIHNYSKQMKVVLYQAHQNILNNVQRLPEPTQTKARDLLQNWDTLTHKFVSGKLKLITDSQDKGFVTRVHGDFHLGQVMVTKDNDLRFIDFAGEPGIPLEQRSQKHISVRDVAGMYRSIKGYLGAVAVEEFAADAPDQTSADARKLYAQKAIKPLMNDASQTFLGKHSVQEPWLALEILRKNLYEVNYEVNNRPHMAHIAIDGLTDLLKPTPNTRTTKTKQNTY